MFRKTNGEERALAGDYAENIYSKLEQIQNETSLVDSGCDKHEEYRMQCSGRRFFDTQCLNMKVYLQLTSSSNADGALIGPKGVRQLSGPCSTPTLK
jgi:hypothetical protein